MTEYNSDEDIKRFEDSVSKMNGLVDSMYQQYYDMCKELGIAPEQLEQFLNDSDNFTPQQWQEMQQQKKQLEEDFERTLANVSTPEEKQQKYKELQQRMHWIKG